MKEKDVPSEIAGETLKHLPVKSLARFNCVSKRWIPLITAIIHGRLREEMDQLLRRLEEIQGNVLRLCDEAEKQALLDRGDAREVLLVCRDRVEVELDEVLALVAFRDDIHGAISPAPWTWCAMPLDEYVRTTIEGLDGWIAETELLQACSKRQQQLELCLRVNDL